MKTAACIGLLVLIHSATTLAQWSTDPNNNLIVGYGQVPQLCSDSAGGAYVTYVPELTYPMTTRLVRLNRYGYQPWGAWRRIRGEFPQASAAGITEDGDGGVLIAYHDQYLQYPPGVVTVSRVRVQRVDSSGNFLWALTGVRVTLSETNQWIPAIVSDGSGGCIVAWRDTMNMIRMQRISNNGVRVWGDSGILVVGNTQYTPRIIKASLTSFIVAFGTLLKKYDLDGNVAWGGQLVNVGFGTRSIIPDNYGGVIVYDGTGTSSNILIVTQRIDSLGAFVWNSPYIVLDDSAIFNVLGNPVTLNVDGGATFAWGKRTGGMQDCRTQIVRSDASTVFAYGGVAISGVPSTKGLVGVLPSDSSTSLCIWADNRAPGGIYAQRLDTLGQAMWDTNDVAMVLISLGGLRVTTDANGGCILIGWRESDFTVRVQQISKYGNLGEVITNVHDDYPDQKAMRFVLYQNYPNPFNPLTIVNFQLPVDNWVTLKLYDILGREVRTLVDGYRQAGYHDVTLDASNLASGVYFYRMTTSSFSDSKKLMLVR